MKKCKTGFFRRAYQEDENSIGFEKKMNTWLVVFRDGDGVYIDKAYMSSEPSLSVKQARRFANKILQICDNIEGIKK